MLKIILDEEQSRIIESALDPVEICDPTGKVLATIEPLPIREEIARAKRIAAEKGPCYSSAQRREAFEVLEKTWEAEGPFDADRAIEIVHRALGEPIDRNRLSGDDPIVVEA